MSDIVEGRLGLQATIAGLRLCNSAQCEVIANLEEYERTVVGATSPDDADAAGYRGGYTAELVYLHSRRQALDSLIAAIERYGQVAEGLTSNVEAAPELRWNT